MMAAERLSWIFLNHVDGLGPIRIHRLLDIAGSAEAILRFTARELTQADVGFEQALVWSNRFKDRALWRAAELDLNREAQGAFRILCSIEPEYPEALRELPDRPPVLYARGRWPIPDTRIGIVGTRRASDYGRQV